MPEANIDIAQPKRRPFLYLKVCPLHILTELAPRLAGLIFIFQPTERILEYPFIHENTPFGLNDNIKVLDIGSGRSLLPFELASKGYRVWCTDFKSKYHRYITDYNNFTFVPGDIRKTSFPDSFFDIVVGVSSIEHVGLAGKSTDLEGDKTAVKEISRIIAPGGKFLITVPFGKQSGIYTVARHDSFRVYNYDRLKELLGEFEMEREQFGVLEGRSWKPSSLEEAEAVDSLSSSRWYSSRAVAMIVARKPYVMARAAS
jgi:SAM-dependent methyltransferase